MESVPTTGKLAPALLALAFGVSRAVYYALGVRTDMAPVGAYLQYIDPALLREHLWQSLWYLREQPPGFNLFLGLALKAGAHADAVIFGAQLLMGLTLAMTVMTLAVRLGAERWLAFALAALFTVSPITVTYEDWVFYEYPVMVALAVAAWALERWVRGERFRYGLIFFGSLAAVTGIRGMYHLAWFVAPGAAAVWVTRRRWRVGAAAAAVPALLVVGLYAKNFVMFGDLVCGGVYQKINYAQIVQQQAPDELLERLRREGQIGGILKVDPMEYTDSFGTYVKPPPATGAMLRDAWRKSTDEDNWNSAWRAKIADAYYRDAKVVAREDSGLFRRQMRDNMRAYFLPASDVFPFDMKDDSSPLRPFLTWYERISGGELAVDPDNDTRTTMAWAGVVVFPVCLAGGVVLAIRWWRRSSGRDELARCAAMVFVLFNIGYNAAVTILFSSGDHNRYREEVAPLYVVLLAVVMNAAWERARARREARRGEPVENMAEAARA